MTTEDVLKVLEPLAKGIGMAASELWKIFVKQYVVGGLTHLLVVLVSGGLGWYLYYSDYRWSVLICIVIGIIFAVSAIRLLGNPAYFALEELTKKIKELKKNSYD